jgi:glycosyltransferase involved in cell wall biosynthesis
MEPFPLQNINLVSESSINIRKSPSSCRNILSFTKSTKNGNSKLLRYILSKYKMEIPFQIRKFKSWFGPGNRLQLSQGVKIKDSPPSVSFETSPMFLFAKQIFAFALSCFSAKETVYFASKRKREKKDFFIYYYWYLWFNFQNRITSWI